MKSPTNRVLLILGAVLLLVGALGFMARRARHTGAQTGAAFSIQPATVAAGASTTVTVALTAPAPGVGSFTFDVGYDPTVVTATSCVVGTPSGASVICNTAVAGSPNIVRFVAASTTGLTGTFTIGTITLQAVGSVGASSALTGTARSVTDANGASLASSVADGSVTIAGGATGATATASPTAAPSATATASPTAAPSSGSSGSTSSGSSSSTSSVTTVTLVNGCRPVLVQVGAGPTSTELLALASPAGNVASIWQYDNSRHAVVALYLSVEEAPIDATNIAVGPQTVFYCVLDTTTVRGSAAQ